FLMFHVLAVTAVVLHINSLDALSKATGFCGSIDLREECFWSPLGMLEEFRWALIATIVFGFANAVLKDTLYKGKELAREFDLWRLLGPGGEFQPAYGDEIVYVNSASMAPTIQAIGETTHS